MIYNNCPSDTRSLLRSTQPISSFLELGKLLKQGFQNVETLAVGDSQWIELRRHHMFSPFRKPVQRLNILTHPDEISIDESRMSLVPFPEVQFLPNNLRSLEIVNSRALKSLPEEMMGNNAQLESLYISHCDSLTFIARCKLPSSLESLDIWYCQNLQQLVVEDELNACSSSPSLLKYLRIYECPELITISSGIKVLEALEYLYIIDCPKLESVPDGLHSLNCLQRLFLHNCPRLASFPVGGLPSTISCISIGGCEKLQALPDNMHKLNSLQELEISECPSIVSFPPEGFPTNLKSLKVEDVKMYKALIEWGLHRLNSLRRLWIHECHNAKSFPDEEMRMMLPNSLTELIIWGSPRLKYLSSMGFSNLTCLEYLWISNCPMLKSFPQFGLPSSLLQLHIDGCPLLKKDFKRYKGKEWSQISHIPRVAIDGKFIYD